MDVVFRETGIRSKGDGLPSPDRDRRLRSAFCIIADGSRMNDARHANDTQNKAGLGLLRDPRE
ncbi:hypothetical protein, partial [Achromobacter sp. 2789STDY5608615]|uniref:hypothetical protein n=1 Tax=Achromobacter sp. 2789STDY5608615 TaxID=1806492 RepID=UPI001E4D9157